MLKALATGATLLASLAATGTAAHAAPSTIVPGEDMAITVAAANGSGCPEGSADVTVSPDNKAFTVTYSKFTAQTGPDAKPTDFRKNCQLALNVHVPQGYTFAIAGADYRGYARLERGATGSESANYYFQGEPQSTRIRHDFSGPADTDWQRSDTVGIGSLSFLPCGEDRYLNVNTELRVNRGWSSRNATSFLTMDSTDGRIDTVYHVAWKQC
ncbi:hypothetical protein ACWT_0201 [Actinoplanes sp. SE50]|uniref:DUF4360 domain-containing protein n=1 Tax=unclassified Actinoplanes TaxID=2626549 RepID=UPI00023ED6F7|nr:MULTISPECIES: DUF4360 domain-containing protein [unclassified Actinoplanes]AEV81213.1 hypothetical protein ACPL_316 [Actinoplanes sp. SE50/110]ATO79616.1 hypothetical protein ACWT_0201 [Actinoplanes sp. SE50]SLL97019.1 hypothetical protein ACSP50_0215 [Actinoplanes sp. SE50/110]